MGSTYGLCGLQQQINSVPFLSNIKVTISKAFLELSLKRMILKVILSVWNQRDFFLIETKILIIFGIPMIFLTHKLWPTYKMNTYICRHQHVTFSCIIHYPECTTYVLTFCCSAKYKFFGSQLTFWVLEMSLIQYSTQFQSN